MVLNACVFNSLFIFMNTYQYNVNKEIKFIRARSRDSALRKIFFGQLKTNGNVDLQKIDLKLVRSPGVQSPKLNGNKVFERLNHI